MKPIFSPKNNPRVIIIQILYGKYYNNDQNKYMLKPENEKRSSNIMIIPPENDDENIRN